MTNSLAHSLQVWFTSRMDTITRRRSQEDKYDKAKRILNTPYRVTTIASDGTDYWVGYVVGDTDTYRVAAVSEDHAEKLGQPRNKRLYCPCRAGSRGVLCSHMIIGEEMRLRGENS
jgi:hypothetical protein